jgi:acyl carrier protein
MGCPEKVGQSDRSVQGDPGSGDPAPGVIDKGAVVADDATYEKFRNCAVEVLQVPADKVVLDARFDADLDADSLDLVEFVMALEEAFDITVDESELDGVETVGQAYELVTTKL